MSKFIDIMYRYIFSLYRFLLIIVNDHEGQMTATLWQRLCKWYSINIKFSSAHHWETGSQTKNANKIMKNYLRAYIAYTQNDWVDHLLMAKFTASNHINALTGVTLFFANHRFYPCTSVEPPRTYKGERQAELLAVNKIVCRKEKMISFLQDKLAWSQDEQTQFANRICQPHSKYKIGDKMYVNARHFASERDKKSFNLKNTGLWETVQNIDNKAYELDIPQTLKDAGLTSIFHLWKIHLAPDNAYPGQVLPLGPSIKISAENDDNKVHKK